MPYLLHVSPLPVMNREQFSREKGESIELTYGHQAMEVCKGTEQACNLVLNDACR